MTGSSPVESQQRYVTEALVAVEALLPRLRDGSVETALRRAHDHALPPTYSAGDVENAEGDGVNPATLRGKGGRTDPTASAALNRIDDEGKAFRMLCSALETLEQAAGDVLRYEKTLRAVTGSAAYQKHLALTGTEANRARDCAQDSCPDPAITGSPHCQDCAAYLAQRPGTAVVPSEVLAARARKRKSREGKGQHVNGPFAEQEAS